MTQGNTDFAINYEYNNVHNLVYYRDNDLAVVNDRGQAMGNMSETGWLKLVLDETSDPKATIAETCPVDYAGYQTYKNSDEVIRRSDV